MYFAVSLLIDVFLFAATLQLVLGAASLYGGIRFHRYVVARLGSSKSHFQGPVSVFVPCRGLEPGLEGNLLSILEQDYDSYEVLFIVDNKDDPAVSVIQNLTERFENTKLVVAGQASDCGQKVQNLTKGVNAAKDSSRAFVFVDSDARPSTTWLSDLLSPLNDDQNGCSTGYRWFVQVNGGIGTHLRSAWNASIVSSLGPDADSNFCWGGSTAIKRGVFEDLNVIDRWKGTVSDDFVLTNAFKNSSRKIHFEPKCLTATIGDCTFGELIEFTTRQMKITRAYSNRHFMVSLIGSALFSITFFSSIIALLFIDGVWFTILATLLIFVWLFGCAKSVLRINAVQKCLPIYSRELRAQYPAQIILWPFSSALFLFNDLAALVSRKITWRGITYKLVSDKETQILNHE